MTTATATRDAGDLIAEFEKRAEFQGDRISGSITRVAVRQTAGELALKVTFETRKPEVLKHELEGAARKRSGERFDLSGGEFVEFYRHFPGASACVIAARLRRWLDAGMIVSFSWMPTLVLTADNDTGRAEAASASFEDAGLDRKSCASLRAAGIENPLDLVYRVHMPNGRSLLREALGWSASRVDAAVGSCAAALTLAERKEIENPPSLPMLNGIQPSPGGGSK